MKHAYITTGEIISPNSLKLDEFIEIFSKRVRIIIEPLEEQKKIKRTFGCAKDWLIIKDDFDAPLDEFKDEIFNNYFNLNGKNLK
ncbi:MAG: hypothetical protein HQK79_08890 [Desulfobacterales bacterium]|nr:hypothetical protein [Desulfobacterales bacterium]